MARQKISFEKEFEKLSVILKKMESSELSLEDTFDCYSKGIEHYKNCKHILETFSQNYTIIDDNFKGFARIEEDEDEDFENFLEDQEEI